MNNSTFLNFLKNSKSTIFILMVFMSLNSFSQTPQIDGEWSGIIPFDIVPVAIANLPDGRILTWSSKSKFSFGGADGFTWTQIFDPNIGTDGGVLPEIVTNTNHDMFCPGINNLADGRIMATGGSSAGKATIFDPVTESWIATDNMNYSRGYQGAVTLADGSAFTIGGSWSGGNGVKDGEIWREGQGWTVLPDFNKEILWNAQDRIYETQQGSYRIDNHAWLWAAPNGKVFHAGPGETMHWMDVLDIDPNPMSVDNVNVKEAGQRGDDIYSMNGTTVMFDIGKILKFGGSYTYSQGTPSSDNAYVIDINDENNVTVTATTNDAEEGRIFPTGVVLPNGETLIIGGMDTAVPFSDNGAHLSLEIFNPTTNMFRTVVDMAEARTYHSAGVLMNDGRVFMGGGGLCGGCNTNHANAEIYSPPYLFDNTGNLATRPTLSAPDTAFYENALPVVTSPDVTDFSFIRLSSATHSVNNEQRRVPVTFTGTNGNYQLNMPNANIMPPGYYMLFAMNADGVPSISEAVLVGESDDVIMGDNLIVAFDFFEGTGSLVNDTSGNNNNGEIIERDDTGVPIALSGDYWNEDGFIGTALQMDGLQFTSNSLVEIPTSPSLEALTNQISVMAWVNRNTGSVIPANGNIPNVAIFAHEFPSLFFGYVEDQYQLRILTDNGLADCVTGQYNPGEWEHVAGTYDGAFVRLYVNGQEICSTPATGNMQINTEVTGDDTFTLAGFYDTRTAAQLPAYANGSGITDELDGSMDKFKLYDIALTAQNIQDIYANEIGDVVVDLEENLALNRPTSQSSLYPNGESEKAVDGNTDGDFDPVAATNTVTHTAAADLNAWWRVDLGDTYDYDLSSIRIFNRTDCCTDRLNGATLYIGNIDSTDPLDYTLVGTLTANSTQTLTQNLGIARYVMIRQSGIISLAEVQVFGQPTNCPAEGTPCDDGDASTSNDIESGDCSCAGTPITCENLEVTYEINGEAGFGETEITVTEGDDIDLLLNLQDVTYTVTAPNGSVLGSNSVNNITIDQSGLYALTSNITLPLSQSPTVYFVNSEETAGPNNVGANAVDGDPNTIWHTRYSDVDPDTPYPHEIQLDLGGVSNVSGLTYLPRQGGVNGTIANYEIYVSNDPNVWGTAVSTGTWANTITLKTVTFPETQGQYVRLLALSEVNGAAWASAAEIDVIATVTEQCVKTLQINIDTIPCDDLAIVYEINGTSGTGETEITVTEGDDIGLFLNSESATYIVEAPDGSILTGNTIDDIALTQSGIYSVISTENAIPQATDPTLLFVSDEHPFGDNDGLNAIDGNNGTFWHSDYSTNPDVAHPHTIALDLGDNSYISGIEYLPRQVGVNGRIANYEIYVSNSTADWGTPVSTGTWPNSNALQTVNFTPVQAKYLRLVALSEVNGQPWTAVAELRVLRPAPTVVFADSEQTGEGAERAIDGDNGTFWHTQYSAGSGVNNAPPPHEIQIDLGVEANVSGVEYLPRQTGVLNGTIADYEVYVSNDPNVWGTAVSTGTWANNRSLKITSFSEVQGRYVRLRALSEVNGNVWTSAAEINVLRAIECIQTIEINVDPVIIYTYNNTGWSPTDPNDVSQFNNDIIIEEGVAEFSMNTNARNVTVNPGATLKVNSGVTLTTNETTLTSISTMYSSLISDGTVQGTIKYERYVNANARGNDLISPPLAGQTWENFLQSYTNADDILNDGNDNPRTYLFGPFDKTQDGYVNYTDAVSTTLASGKGYRAATKDRIGTNPNFEGINLTFTGTVPDQAPISVNITFEGATFPDWNLIGNPYPSYLDMDLFLKHILDTGTDPVDPSDDITNLSILEDISGIYGYAAGTIPNTDAKWDVITLSNATTKLMAPGQGFLVAANAAFVNDFDIVFDPSMRVAGINDDFIQGRTNNALTFLKIQTNASNKDYTTEFYFNTNSSLGLDPGYDGRILGNTAPNFALYSHLVEDNVGLPIALQSLNPSDLTNTIVPLGVNASQGEQLTFSISDSTLPTDVEVYLEDNVTNTITLLNTGNYTFTPSTTLSGTGRFYLRLASTALSVNPNELDYLQIYTTTNPKALFVKGQLNDATIANLYDVQGRLVLSKKLNQFEVLNTIDISNVGTGVYIIKVSNNSQTKTQKLVIN